MGREIENKYCHEIPSDPEKFSFVRDVKINYDTVLRDRLEEIILTAPRSQVFVEEALAGVTINGYLEHIPRLVSDQITLGRDSYSIQSWRYVEMHFEKGDAQKIHIPEAVKKANLEDEYAELARKSIEAYEAMREMRVPKEDARYAFLWSFDSHAAISLQGPKLVDFCLANLNSPYESLRKVAEELLAVFKTQFPHTAEMLEMMAARDGLSKEERSLLNYIREPLWLKPGEETNKSWQVNDPFRTVSIPAHLCYAEGAPTEFVDNYSEAEQQKIVGDTLSSEHKSVAEHSYFIVRFAMSQPGLQQLRRHRIPVQRAQDMWVAAEGEYPLVVPPSIQKRPQALDIYREVWQKSVEFRNLGISKGVPLAELDNAVMVGIRVPVFLVTNATDALHIGKLRLCRRAQWEVRKWMYDLSEYLITTAPELFTKLGPTCFTGECQEKNPCKRPDIYQDWRNKIIWPKQNE